MDHFQVALVALWGGVEGALGCLLVAYWLPSKWLWRRFMLALGGFGMALDPEIAAM
jgi:hypothetical protein